MRLVGIGNHYGIVPALADVFQTTAIFTGKENEKLQKGDVVVFGGGEDISPFLYNQVPSIYTSASSPSRRDLLESVYFNMAKENKIPMIGICRGAQLICALAGGSLIQHVTNHAGRDHKMMTDTGREIVVCSVHHQMMNPFGTKHKLLAWASQVLSKFHLIEGEKNVKMEKEPEVVFFEDIKALGIQYHPEFMVASDEAVIYAKELIKEYILK